MNRPAVGPAARSLTRKGAPMVFPAALALLACLAMATGVLLVRSPGTPRPVVDAGGRIVPGSIAEKIRVPINGVDQGMFIRAKDPTKPVLLFVHGGPGMPTYFLDRAYPTGLEQDFVVCWWEQRGAGLSYSDRVPPETMTYDQMILDTIAVTNYLRERFGQDKIYLMGHSNGSFIAIQAAARAPELYQAYIGVSQIARQIESENRSLEYLKAEYRRRGDTTMARKLEAIPTPLSLPLPAAWDSVRDEAMHGAGVGTTRDMRSVLTGVFLATWLDPEYTVGEKVDIWRGKRFSKDLMWNEMQGTDLTNKVTELRVPAYFFHGAHDYTIVREITRSYVQKLKAPVKGFYTFSDSAHSPVYEEAGLARRILREDVLTGRTNLADARPPASTR